MSEYWRDGAGAASGAQREQFAPGIAKAQIYLDNLARKGEIPTRFIPDRPRLHPSLEGRALQEILTIGGNSKDRLAPMVTSAGGRVSPWALDLTSQDAFTTLKDPTETHLVKVKVGVLVPKPKGRYATTEEIFDGAKDVDLTKVPAETAFYYRLAHMDQPKGEWDVMVMEPITDSDGDPRLLGVEHDGYGLWVRSDWAEPSYRWGPGSTFVFSPSK